MSIIHTEKVVDFIGLLIMPMLNELVIKNVPIHPLTEVRGVLGTVVKTSLTYRNKIIDFLTQKTSHLTKMF